MHCTVSFLSECGWSEYDGVILVWNVSAAALLEAKSIKCFYEVELEARCIGLFYKYTTMLFLHAMWGALTNFSPGALKIILFYFLLPGQMKLFSVHYMMYWTTVCTTTNFELNDVNKNLMLID